MKWGEKTVDRLYFVGIGGIGMSGLARYAQQLGLDVAGYDKTQTALTNELEKEGRKAIPLPSGEDLDAAFSRAAANGSGKINEIEFLDLYHEVIIKNEGKNDARRD